MPEPAASARRSVLIELALHAIAFCMATAIGATVLSRYYAILSMTPIVQARRETRSSPPSS